MSEPIALWRVILAISSVVLILLIGWLRSDWAAFRAFALSVAGTVGYALIQDQFSVRLCLEYFTVAHPRLEGIPQTELMMGLVWPVLGSLGGALIGGMSLACCCHLGTHPPLPLKKAGVLVLAVVVLMALTTITSGAVGYTRASTGVIPVEETLGYDIPAEKHHGFWTVAYAHLGTYTAGISGGIIACFVALFWRSRLARESEQNQSIT